MIGEGGPRDWYSWGVISDGFVCLVRVQFDQWNETC